MGDWINVSGEDGHRMRAWHERPAQPKAGVVLLQEVFGVNEHIRAVAASLAAAGFEVVAPSLFDRLMPRVELGYGPDGIERGVSLMKQAAPQTAVRDVQAAAAALSPGLPRGVVGFCWGGFVAWLAAAQVEGLSAAVCYYPGGIDGAVEAAPRVPVLVHLAERDEHIPVQVGQTLRKKYPERVRVHTYDAMHGFHCDARASHDASSAALAWERTIGFLGAQAAAGKAAA